MKFGLMFSNTGPFGQPEGCTHLAQTAESCGIESLWTVEHVAVPVGYESKYPYSKDGKMPGPENSPIPDPLVWLGFAAAVTTKIKLATVFFIVTESNEIYTAKEFAKRARGQSKHKLGSPHVQVWYMFDALTKHIITNDTSSSLMMYQH